MKRSLLIGALALSAGMCSGSFGQVTGKVTLTGKVPEMAEIAGIKNAPDCAKEHKDPVYEETVVAGDKGELANVVVSVKAPEGKDLGTTPTTPVVIDQKGCVYSPHVIAVAVGQPVTVKNSDTTLHNVHSLAIDNPAFNFGQPTVGQKKLEPFKTEENFKIKCDVHPWMACWVRVVNNPYFAVSSAAEKGIGTYSIDTKGLPDGEYTFVAWHEKYGTQEQKGKVTGGKAEVNFTFDADKKAAASPAKELKVASTAACCDAKAVASK
jgi:plastocyanin